MPDDGVGVGDIGEVSVDAWSTGDTASGDDGRGAGSERDTGMVGGHEVIQCHAFAESRWDWFVHYFNTWSEHGACDVHGAGTGGAHGMRGDRVGVGDIG